MNKKSKYRDLQDMMNTLGATKSQKQLLNFIVKNKDSPGEFVTGKIQIAVRNIRDNLGVAMGTITRGLEFWQQKGVISIYAGEHRRAPNIIRYIGAPLTVEDDSFAYILDKLNTLKDVINSMEAQLDAIKLQRKSQPMLLTQAPTKVVGEVDGKILVAIAEPSELP